MKNLFFLLVLSCTFSACTRTDDDCDILVVEEPLEREAALARYLEGRWQMTRFEIAFTSPRDVPAGDIIVTLDPNNAGLAIYGPTAPPLQNRFVEGSFNWEIDRGFFVINDNFWEFTLSGNVLILEQDAVIDGERKFTFARIP